MAQGTVNLRAARWADCWQVYRWKNLPENVAVSATGHPVSGRTHSKWFSGILHSPNHRLWIVEPSAGFVRADRIQGTVWISLFIVAGQRGRGWGTAALKRGVCLAWIEWPTSPMQAVIRDDNPASERTFRSVGFTCVGRKGSLGYYRHTDGVSQSDRGQSGEVDPAVDLVPGGAL
jgi:L-amino acid N-acyltransferase YncA